MSDIVVIRREQRITVEPISQVVAVLDIGKQGPPGINADDLQVPRARLQRGTNQAITFATLTALSFSSAVYDYGSLWNAGLPTRLTAPIDGLYTMGAGVRFQGGTASIRVIRLVLNGTFTLKSTAVDTGTTAELSVNTEYELEAGDYIEAMVYHGVSPGPLNSEFVLSPGAPSLYMRRVGPLAP